MAQLNMTPAAGANKQEVTNIFRNPRVDIGIAKHRYEAAFESGIFSDVLFIVGAKQQGIKAHKIILSTGSKVFETIFKEDVNNGVFRVPELEPEEFKLLLKFLYTGESPTNVEQCIPVMAAASKYGILDLADRCGKLVCQTLTQGSAIKVFQQTVKYRQPELEEVALEYICKNAVQIVGSATFLNLSVEELRKILERDELEVKNETQLFEAVMNWGRAECKRQSKESPETPKFMRSVLEKVIRLIRFPLMDPSDFSLKVAPTQILSTEEVMSVLLYFNVNQPQRASAPTGVFSSKPRKPRYPRGTKFILTRLVRNDRALVMDLAAKQTTGHNWLLASGEHSIWLKSSMPICVTSIGMNSIAPNLAKDCSNTISVKIQLKDADNRVLSTQEQTFFGFKSWTRSLYHVQFAKLVNLRQNDWYMASFKVTGGCFYAAPYTALDGVGTNLDFKLPDGSGRVIKFEFKDVAYAEYTGTTQGFIPEIGFTVD